MVASNKDRLYVALYARGGLDPDTYHWAIIVGPKNESDGSRGTRVHARQRLDPTRPGHQVWNYEAQEIPLTQTSMLLARIMIGKILDRDRLFRVLSSVPVVQDDPTWNCVTWVRKAIAMANMDGKCIGTGVTDWDVIKSTSISFVTRKRQERRYDGSGNWELGSVPTYDLIGAKEVVP